MKVHWGSKEDGDRLYVTWCKRFVPTVAEHWTLVTCGICGPKVKKAVKEGRIVDPLEWPKPMPDPERRFDSFPRGREHKPAEPVTLEMLRKIRCTCGDSWCPVCKWADDLEDKYIEAQNEKAQLFPGTRWRSGESALKWYAGVMGDGLYRVSCSLAAPDRVDGGEHAPAYARLILDTSLVEWALAQWYRDPGERVTSRGLNAEKLHRILFGRTVGDWADIGKGRRARVPVLAHELAAEVGHGLTAVTLGPILRQGRDAVYEALRTEGAIP